MPADQNTKTHINECGFEVAVPETDSQYLANLTFCILRVGLNRKVIENKWSTIKTAFDDFNIDKISSYGEAEFTRLMGDPGIIRNGKKIQSVIDNAREFVTTRIDHGSFAEYLNSLRPEGEKAMLKKLGKKFSMVGPTTAFMFMKESGEDFPETTAEYMQKNPNIH